MLHPPSSGPHRTLAGLLVLLSLAAGAGHAQPAAVGERPSPPIPVLNWEPRSDWRSVQAAGAVGDGVADDTAAIQSVLDTVGDKFTVYAGDLDSIYFPPGTYRLTAPLRVGGEVRLHGVLLVGHGRDTRLVWDGPEGQPMLIADGLTYARYEGLVFDGRGKASVGLLHPNTFFTTESRYRHLAFLNCTDTGIFVPPQRAAAQSDPMYENCYFENCGRGVAFLQFNDYHHTFDGCEFRNCGIGIECDHGSFYVRNTHFAGSRTADVIAHNMHSSSIRRVTSLDSRAFLLYSRAAGALTVQDVQVASAAPDPAGVVQLSGAPPVTLFDGVFTLPAGSAAPLDHASEAQPLLLSNNRVEGAAGLLQREGGRVYQIPPGARGGALRSAEQTFLKDTVRLPGKVFDAVRDFGAQGDGRTDDTAALQATIDAARAHGRFAIAYLPAGLYLVTATLQLTGDDYYFGGQGWGTMLRWGGPEGGTLLHVGEAHNLTVEYMTFATGPDENNAVDILQSGTPGGSAVVYDGLRVFGCYQKQPFRKGLHLVGLGARDQVVINTLQGNLRITNSGDATILGNFTWEGSVTVEGRDTGREGFLGFVTRLSTITTHGLYVRDNHSFVAGDFYNEQSDGMMQLSGAPDLPPGRVVLTGGRSHLWIVPEVPPDFDNYRGEVFLGGKDFSDYRTPEEPPHSFRQTGDARLDLYIFGNLFYGSKLEVDQRDSLRLHLIGNSLLPDDRFVHYDPVDDYDEAALAALARAFDDLRRLGELDLRLNHPAGP